MVDLEIEHGRMPRRLGQIGVQEVGDVVRERETKINKITEVNR